MNNTGYWLYHTSPAAIVRHGIDKTFECAIVNHGLGKVMASLHWVMPGARWSEVRRLYSVVACANNRAKSPDRLPDYLHFPSSNWQRKKKGKLR